MTGYEALRMDVAWLDLSARGILRLTGEDRARLLHALSTTHIQDLSPGAGVYAFFLNEKGRILADSYIYNLGESFLLDTEPETAATLRDHLDRYIIADDVTVEDQTGRRPVIGLEGPASFERAATLGIPVPGQPFGIEPYGDGFVARVAATGLAGLRLWLSTAEKEALLADIPEAMPQEARIVRLENGLPRYGEDITSRFLVQETQLLHAVHFNKGCYLGQEIVERVRSRGQVHRLLTPIQLAGAAAPEPGTKLTIDGKAAEITSAAYSPALGKVVALAYVRTER
ncbi:MAG TPA: glycine cleavage T C-terminal barrel domain-containing protein [Bryobacteraceae bacterium]|jgi:aminomethyltransferase